MLESPPSGWRPGKDVAGIVVREAANGLGPPLGCRVVAHPECGGWAERVAVPLERLAAVPDHVPLHVAAALPLAGLTALRLTRVAGSLAAKRVLVTGASGGVGHYLTELAVAGGAEMTAVVGSAEHGQRLLQLGACHVLTDIYQAESDYDVVIDSVGGDVFRAAWRRLATHGLFIWMGQASRRQPMLDFLDWSGGTSAILRKFLYSDDPVTVATDLATLVRLVVACRLHPELDSVRPWLETPDVLQALLHRQVRGNAVLEIDHNRGPGKTGCRHFGCRPAGGPAVSRVLATPP